MNASLPDRLTQAAFSGIVLLGGLNAFVVRFSNQELPPIWSAAPSFVLKRWTGSATSSQFVLLPFITIIVAVWLAHETLSFTVLMSTAFVLSGVYVGALHKANL